MEAHRGRINEPGVEDAGEREENIERVRQWRCCAFRSPPFSERNPPGEGRIVTGGVRPAQQRLLDVEVMMLVITDNGNNGTSFFLSLNFPYLDLGFGLIWISS